MVAENIFAVPKINFEALSAFFEADATFASCIEKTLQFSAFLNENWMLLN